MVFGKANDSSRDEDKYIQLPKISYSELPDATTCEGAIAYDSYKHELVFSNGTDWETITATEISPSASPSVSPS